MRAIIITTATYFNVGTQKEDQSEIGQSFDCCFYHNCVNDYFGCFDTRQTLIVTHLYKLNHFKSAFSFAGRCS